MNTQEYKFTFDSHDELREAELSGYIETYDCVRITRTEGLDTVDYPCKTKEELDWSIDAYGSNIIEIYPTVHSYDVQDYL